MVPKGSNYDQSKVVWATTEEFIKGVLAEINAARKCINILANPLVLDESLQKAAQWMANDMVMNAARSGNRHIDSGNNQVTQRARKEGFNPAYTVAENLLAIPKGQVPQTGVDKKDIVERWLCSKQDRELMVDKSYTHCGIAFARGKLADPEVAVCLVLGAVPSSPTPKNPLLATTKCTDYKCFSAPKA